MRYKRKDSLAEGRKAILSIRTKKENDEGRTKSEKKGGTWRGKRRGERGTRVKHRVRVKRSVLGIIRESFENAQKARRGPDERALGKMNNGDRRRSRNGAERLYKGPQSKISRSLCFFHEKAATEPLSFSVHEKYISDRVTPRSNFPVPRRDSVSDNLSR